MLEERTAIVTGGARGIGFAIAKELASQGADVVVCSRTQSQLNDAVGQLAESGKKAYGITADVSEFEDCQKLIDFALEKAGRIDILVNNAGTFGPVGLLETNDPNGWRSVVAINILGAVYCAKLAIPHMKKQGGGKIINLLGAGVGGIKTMPRFCAYFATKTAIAGFTECLAAELEPFNIQVNAISPGAVASNLTLGLLNLPIEQVGEEMYQTSQKLKDGEGTSPELTADLVRFLVSHESDGVTGRLISAKWDDYRTWAGKKVESGNLYRLRRIDNKIFFEQKE